MQQWLETQRPGIEPIETAEEADESSSGEEDGAVGLAADSSAATPTDIEGVRYCGFPGFWGHPLGRYETAESFAERIYDELLTRVIREVSPPRIYQLDGTGAVRSSQALVDLDLLVGDSAQQLGEFVSITAIDIDTDFDPRSTVCVPAPGRVTVMDGGERLFIFSERWDSPAVVSDWTLLPNTTQVTAISFQDPGGSPGGPRVTARGQFQGSLLNEFAADAQGGLLRIVVENADWWRGGTSVIVLEQQADDLVEIGRLDGLAVREDLHAVRFAGERVYFVTYERIDPLFVVDLSTPSHPTLLGELKVSGYSEFIHILDRDLILAIGRDVAEGNAWNAFGPLQISVFDVSDPSAPRLVDRHEFSGGRGTTTAVTGNPWIRGDGDPLALGAYGAEGVITIPVSDGNGDQWVEVVSVDAAGAISRIGVIDHVEQVERTVKVGDRLVGVSDSDVTVHDFAGPTAVIARIPLDCGLRCPRDGTSSDGPEETVVTVAEESDASEPVIPVPGDVDFPTSEPVPMTSPPDESVGQAEDVPSTVTAAAFASLFMESSQNHFSERKAGRNRPVRLPA
ncbi:MAG: beta-propeller domain-containing protein [Planctomycetota bacterium]